MNPKPLDRPAGAFAERVRRCVELAGSGNELARRAGIPRRTLENYLAGDNEPTVSRLVKLADAAGVSLLWLATGTGPVHAGPPGQQSTGVGDMSMVQAAPRSALDEDLLVAVVVAVDELIHSRGLQPSSEKKARLIAAVYEDEVAGAAENNPTIDRSRVARLLRLVG